MLRLEQGAASCAEPSHPGKGRIFVLGGARPPTSEGGAFIDANKNTSAKVEPSVSRLIAVERVGLV